MSLANIKREMSHHICSYLKSKRAMHKTQTAGVLSSYDTGDEARSNLHPKALTQHWKP